MSLGNAGFPLPKRRSWNRDGRAWLNSWKPSYRQLSGTDPSLGALHVAEAGYMCDRCYSNILREKPSSCPTLASSPRLRTPRPWTVRLPHGDCYSHHYCLHRLGRERRLAEAGVSSSGSPPQDQEGCRRHEVLLGFPLIGQLHGTGEGCFQGMS